jgi:hypothetical protein
MLLANAAKEAPLLLPVRPLRYQDRARSFLIAEWGMIRPQSTVKAQMKTILMLIVWLMFAGCGSMENHVRNHGVASTSRFALQDRGNGIAVDTICACP